MIQSNPKYPNLYNNQKQVTSGSQQNNKYNQQNHHSYTQLTNPKLALINKNYILPPNQAFSGQSNYVNSYTNKSDQRIKTQKFTQNKNQIMPKGNFDGNTSYLIDYYEKRVPRGELKHHEDQLKVGGKFEGLSNYNQNYLNNQNVQRQQKIVHPNNLVMPDGKFDNMSTYNGNYTGNSNEKRQIIKHEGNLKVGGGQFVGQSTYGNDYIQGHTQRNAQIRPQGQLKIGGQFSGSSNYTDNYPNKGVLSKAQKYVPPQNKMFPQGRFEDNTTYNGNYLENQIQKIKQIKPESQLKVGGGKFDSLSNYNHDYLGINAQQKRQKVVYKQNDILPKGNFEGNSNYQQNYILTESLNRAKPIKIQGQLKIGGQFYGQSSYNQNYYNKGNRGKTQRVNYPPNYVMPQGAFQNGTNYTENYIQNPIERNKIVKPEGSLKIGNQQFQGTSNYNAEYVAYQGQKRRQRTTHPQNIVMPKGHFQGNSTYVDAYVPTVIQKNSQIKPGNNLEVGGKFQGNSSYTQDYDKAHGYPRYLSKQNEYSLAKK